MITLLTGVPGSGKTAYALNLMINDYLKSDSSRPLFVHGIPDLKLPHETVVCSSIGCDCCPNLPQGDYLKADEWHNWAPDGAVMFYDEVQTIHRPRSSSAKVPEVIAAYEIHRHRGLDFILITQNPNLIDANVKRLVSKHIHLTTNWAHRIQYEWPECQNNVQSVSTAVKSNYSIPKKVFGLYKSASLHTKVKRKTPAIVWIFAALLIIGFFGVRSFYQNNIKKFEKNSTELKTVTENATGGGQQPEPDEPHRLDQFDFNPKIPDHPESAPAYEAIVKPVVFPQLVGCVESKTKCSCYTQQATKYLMSIEQCHDYIKQSRFNPYRRDPKDSSLYPRFKQPNQSSQADKDLS